MTIQTFDEQAERIDLTRNHRNAHGDPAGFTRAELEDLAYSFSCRANEVTTAWLEGVIAGNDDNDVVCHAERLELRAVALSDELKLRRLNDPKSNKSAKVFLRENEEYRN